MLELKYTRILKNLECKKEKQKEWAFMNRVMKLKMMTMLLISCNKI